MKAAGVPCVPGSDGPLPTMPKDNVKSVRRWLSGDHQGCGRRRRSQHARCIPKPHYSTPHDDRAEAKAAFGNDVVYGKFLENHAT